MNPLHARLRFKLRSVTNLLYTLALFVLLVLFLPQFIPTWIADLLAIAVAFVLYFFILDRRAIGLRCPHCRKYIATNTPWICGFCKTKNQRVHEFPFANRCEHCEAEPKAYKCHHRDCGKLIFLTGDYLEQNYAHCINPPVEDKTQDEISQQDRERRSKTHELTIADLDEKLEAYKRRQELGKKKSPIEAVKEKFEKEYADVMAAEDFALEQKAANNEKYKNDPETRDRKNEFVDSWLKRHI